MRVDGTESDSGDGGHDIRREGEGDVEQAHVLGALRAIGQRVARQRPVDGGVEAIADAVDGTEEQHQGHRRGVEDDEDERDPGLDAAAGVDEGLAPVTIRHPAADESERGGEDQDDEQPDRVEHVGVADADDVAEEEECER